MFSAAHDGSDPDPNVLAAFVDGRLHGDDQRAVRDHLASCSRCRTIVAELTRTRAAATSASWTRTTLPLAASLALAAVAGGVFWLVRDARVPQPPPAVQPAPSSPPIAPAQPPGTTPSPGAIERPPAAAAPPGVPPDRTREAGTRTIAGKTFRLVAGEWVDVDARIADVSALVDIRSPEEFSAHANLRPFAPLGRRFTVALDGTIYRVDLPSAR